MDLFVDPDSLRTAALAITATGLRAGPDLAFHHRDAATGGATAWGQGADARLGTRYQELPASTGEALDLLAAVLDRGSAAVAGMGAAYAATDGDAGEGFDRIADGLRSPT